MLRRSFGLRQLDQNNTTRRAQPCPLVCCQAINVAHMQDGVHNEEKSTRGLSAAYNHHRAETSLRAPWTPTSGVEPGVCRPEWYDWPGPALGLPAVGAPARLRRLGMLIEPANDVLLER